MIPDRARRRALTALALDIFGVRRRWWGLEPDWMLRRRLLRGFLASSPERRPAGMPPSHPMCRCVATWSPDWGDWPRRSWWQRLTRK